SGLTAGPEDSGIFEETKRAQWDNKVQYLLSCIGFVIGFGNMWRFPYLCQVYGGGAFLIPYLIALVFEGIPIFYLEIAIGQTLRKGSIGAWNQISPYLGGLGVASLTLAFLVSLYYTMILAWVFWFFINSFQQPLPWSFCPQNPLAEECNKTTTTNYYWYRHTLNISTDITESGPLLWWMVTCLAASWTIVYLCTIRGIESVGKVRENKISCSHLDSDVLQRRPVPLKAGVRSRPIAIRGVTEPP
uniref:Transporter n=1 Tax=Salvator merianae TaxID=96440 RepID=A0A8D0DPN1_SALMN